MSDQSQPASSSPEDVLRKHDEELVNPPAVPETAPVNTAELKAGAAERAKNRPILQKITGTKEFKLTDSTTFDRRQKKATTAASASDAATGMRARIEAKGQTAVKVTLKKAPKDGKKAKHGTKAGGRKAKNK